MNLLSKTTPKSINSVLRLLKNWQHLINPYSAVMNECVSQLNNICVMILNGPVQYKSIYGGGERERIHIIITIERERETSDEL